VETLDETLDQGEVFGTIEAVKTVSDMMMPVGGTVIEVNEDLADEPEDVNKDPYGKGWLIKIKLSDSGQLDSLLDHNAYKANIEA
jgi:glycine cleavage system H protein